MSVNVLTDDGLLKIAGNGGSNQEIQAKIDELENLIQQVNQKVDSITKESLGLGNVDNTHDYDKNVNSAKSIARQYIPPNSDLNDYKDIGVFYNSTNVEVVTFLNSPTNISFFMSVYKSAGVTQEITEYRKINPKKWFRNWDYDTNSWGPWYRIYTEADPQP